MTDTTTTETQQQATRTMGSSVPTISVIVPTYRRVSDLQRCLQALGSQVRLADEILIVFRDSDKETRSFVESLNSDENRIRFVSVTQPGQVAALNVGLEAATGELIAITDDDAAPAPDWLARIEQHFRDPSVGGVGGRDRIIRPEPDREELKRTVGVVQWWGRVIGNHHVGQGPPRSVHVLKGANMSFRRVSIQGIRFDHRLRGNAAQLENDLAFSLAVRRAGWELIYDPAVLVDHYAAEKHRAPGEKHEWSQNTFDAAFNETLVLLENMPTRLRRVVYLTWAALVGTHVAPGLVNALRLCLRGETGFGVRLIQSFRGRVVAWNTVRREDGMQ